MPSPEASSGLEEVHKNQIVLAPFPLLIPHADIYFKNNKQVYSEESSRTAQLLYSHPSLSTTDDVQKTSKSHVTALLTLLSDSSGNSSQITESNTCTQTHRTSLHRRFSLGEGIKKLLAGGAEEESRHGERTALGSKERPSEAPGLSPFCRGCQ